MAAAEQGIGLQGQTRLSFVHRKLVEQGARFGVANGGLIAVDFGDEAAGVEMARRMGLADLSPLARTGFKGMGSVEWLAGQGVTTGAESNRGYRQAGGEIALRLAPNEVLLVDSLAAEGRFIAQLEAAWSWGEEKPRRPIGYPMPRADSHCWFALSGLHAAEMFSKICGVDLRAHRFAEGAIAQTSVARMSGIILRHNFAETPGFYLLADSASGDYLWDCLLDAMMEFEGAPVGLSALQILEGY
jgi:sarcosine oxidase subunit gamma